MLLSSRLSMHCFFCRHLQGDDDRRFDGLKGQFEGIKAMQKATAGSGVGRANHGKFCLCG